MPGADRPDRRLPRCEWAPRAIRSCSLPRRVGDAVAGRHPHLRVAHPRGGAGRPSRGPRSCASARATGARSPSSTSSGSRPSTRPTSRASSRTRASSGTGRRSRRRSTTHAPARAARAGIDPVDHLWSFVGGRTKVNAFERMSDLPAETAESKAMSRDLARRGFRFVGPTICYAYMQAVGLVDDHTLDCFRQHAAIPHQNVRRPPEARGPGRADPSRTGSARSIDERPSTSASTVSSIRTVSASDGNVPAATSAP